MRALAVWLVAGILLARTDACAADDARVLATEVAALGWIAYCAPSESGDWDIFLVRPDGSEAHPITRTPATNEIWPRFSRDGSRILFRRLPRADMPDGNRYGAQGEPVVADSNGRHPHAIGGPGELPWAAWGPDSDRFATLSREGIFVISPTGERIRTLPRKGFFQQLAWSPDGLWFAGVSNAFATSWSVARMNAETGASTAVAPWIAALRIGFPTAANSFSPGVRPTRQPAGAHSGPSSGGRRRTGQTPGSSMQRTDVMPTEDVFPHAENMRSSPEISRRTGTRVAAGLP